MAKKSNEPKKINPKKKSGFWNNAMNFFIFGCLAELYILVVRQYYVYGTNDQLLAWDVYLKNVLYFGLGLLLAGAVLTIAFRKSARGRRIAAGIVLGVGIFLSLANWLVRTYYISAVTLLCVLIPVVMLLGIFWTLYDRECSVALTILAVDAVVLWICRKGIGTDYWNTKVLIGAVAFLVLLAAFFLLSRGAEKHKGLIGKLRLLPENADYLPVYVACGLSALSVVLALFNATIAYYALWVVGVAIFALAVYYTVRQL
jgi:hypothetical protein